MRPGLRLATPPKTIHARSAIAEEAIMQTIRPPTHQLRLSPLQPVALGWPATDYEDAVHDLFSSISVLAEQCYDSGARPAKLDAPSASSGCTSGSPKKSLQCVHFR